MGLVVVSLHLWAGYILDTASIVNAAQINTEQGRGKGHARC